MRVKCLIDNIQLSTFYKESIINEFPESQPAQLLTNPDYINELREKENEVNRFYENTYYKFNQGFYEQVIIDVDTAMQRFKDSELIPQFFFMKVLAIGKTQDRLSFSIALDSISNTYPGHEVSDRAKDILAFLKDADPVVKIETQKIEAEELYSVDTTSAFFYGLVVADTIDINQLKFEIINFNLDNFPNISYDVVSEDLDGDQVVIFVQTFAKMEDSWEYLDLIPTGDLIFSLLEGSRYFQFIISQPNSEVLLQDKVANKYRLFFREHYQRR